MVTKDTDTSKAARTREGFKCESSPGEGTYAIFQNCNSHLGKALCEH